MKKIDLHIHTKPTVGKDAHFVFDIVKFQEYVNELCLDAIAITNHNLFDLAQFQEITEQITNVVIFPGIEIDFQEGHLLLIGDNQDLDDFNQKCELVTQEIASNGKVLTEKLKEIFQDLDKYLLIPHYTKKPKISQSTINSLGDYIFTGEVHSPKNFYRTMKEPSALSPVLFSDVRIESGLDIALLQGKHTFINTNASPLSFSAIKVALRDRNKVSLSGSGKDDFFQVFNNGQELSSRLNVILGGRSSGKSFILNKLRDIYDTGEKSVKYIKQFELVRGDEKKFNERVENEKSAIREEFLKDFRGVVEDVVGIERQTNDYNLGKYITTLLDYASSEKLQDEYSKAKLFKENIYQIRLNEEQELKTILNAVIQLIANINQRDIIDKHVSKDNLEKLFSELESKFRSVLEVRLKKQWVNEIVKDSRIELESKTSSPKIDDGEIDLYKIKLEREKVRRFNAIGKALQDEVQIRDTEAFGKFKIRAIASPYTGAQALHDESGRQISFADAYKEYYSPISFLEKLKRIEGLNKSELYKYFCRVSYTVLNEYDKKVSGGEMAEFNLLRVLQDARQYDMLLIDEPESSFDNLFLKKSVNGDIKSISEEMPVVVVTHNNTVGMLLEPNYILFTKREIIDGKDEYKIFSGALGEKELKMADGTETINSYDTLLDTMEAGDDAYQQRASLYNNLRP